MQADARTTCSCVCWGLHCCEGGKPIENRNNKHSLAWYEKGKKSAKVKWPDRYHLAGDEQRGTPYMDGVPGVTQCPISPGATFVYKWRPQGLVLMMV